MTKSELIEIITAKQKHLPAKDVELALKQILEIMSDALSQGERIEIRGLGIRRLPYEPAAVIRLVVDLAAAAERMPPASTTETEIAGVRLPRLAVAPGEDPFSLVFASLTWGAAWPDASSPGRAS